MRNFLKHTNWVFVFLLLFGCDIDRNNPGYEYFDDMTRSAAYETYTPNENFKDGKTNQWIPEGAVPITGAILHFEKTEENRAEAAEELINPLESTVSNRVKGKELYGIYCDNCHGSMGDGKGFLYTSKKYPYPPASLVNEKMKSEKSGGIYHAITAGYGVMGAHGPQLQPDDRWRVVLYIQDELQAKHIVKNVSQKEE